MKVEERLLRDWGETEAVELAGYILPDGTLLNMSYDGFSRTFDHREVGYCFRKRTGTEALIEMMRRGNIRVCCSKSSYGFEFIKKPTRAQLRVIEHAYVYANKYGIWCGIDKCNNSGRVIKSYYELYDL